MKKIRIAFVKYGGLTSGGSEKLLQFIAANLPKDLFDVTFFYCDQTFTLGAYIKPKPTDESRVLFLKENKVRLIKFNVGLIDLTSPYLRWHQTNFWDVFNEKSFDIIQTCRAGHKEYPFTEIKNTPIVDILALSAGADNQFNVSKVVHLSTWSYKRWVKSGGDPNRSVIGSMPIFENIATDNFLDELDIKNKFVFGMHQREDDSIFSELPLEAYSKIENSNTAFIIMGGSKKYQEQAKALNLKNCFFIEYSSDPKKIFKFLRTLSVFAHGRKDGEINSQSIAEALSVGLPIVSHISKINNGHIECIANAGLVTGSVDEYSQELVRLMFDAEYYKFRSGNSRNIFLKKYEPKSVMQFYAELYYKVVENPYPKKMLRFYYSIKPSQNIRLILVSLYRKFIFLIRLFMKLIRRSKNQ